MYSSPTHLLIPENCLGFKSTSNIIVSTGIRYLKKKNPVTLNEISQSPASITKLQTSAALPGYGVDSVSLRKEIKKLRFYQGVFLSMFTHLKSDWP